MEDDRPAAAAEATSQATSQNSGGEDEETDGVPTNPQHEAEPASLTPAAEGSHRDQNNSNSESKAPDASKVHPHFKDQVRSASFEADGEAPAPDGSSFPSAQSVHFPLPKVCILL